MHHDNYLCKIMASSLQPTLVFLILANLMLYTTGQDNYCIDIGNNYTTNGTYQSNLNTVLSSVSTSINSTGFITASSGQNPDRVNAITLCRGDIQLDTCHGCVQNATTEIVRLCPNRRQVVLWYQICMLRYSNEEIVGVLVTAPGSDLSSFLNVTSPDEFRGDLRTLLDDLRERAAYGGNSTRKVAAGTRVSADSQTIYALVQCTPDLSPQDCDSCLVNAANDLPMCCDRRIGARILRPSCNLHYEITPFYDATRLPVIVSVGSPSSGTSSSSCDDSNSLSEFIILQPDIEKWRQLCRLFIKNQSIYSSKIVPCTHDLMILVITETRLNELL